MAIDVTTETLIKRRCEAVANCATDPDNAPRWYVNIKAVEWQTPRPLRVGSRLAFVARFLGRQLVYTYEIIELTPRRLVMRTAEGAFPMETTYEFEPAASGSTRMRLRNRGAPTGVGRLLGPFIAYAVRRKTTQDLARLKALLERAV